MLLRSRSETQNELDSSHNNRGSEGGRERVRGRAGVYKWTKLRSRFLLSNRNACHHSTSRSYVPLPPLFHPPLLRIMRKHKRAICSISHRAYSRESLTYARRPLPPPFQMIFTMDLFGPTMGVVHVRNLKADKKRLK